MNILVRQDTQNPAVLGGRLRFRSGGLVRFFVGLGLLAGAALGALFTLKGGGQDLLCVPTVEGTWELAALNGEPAGSLSVPGVVWQRVSFRGGKVRGETLIQSSLESGLARLPFPDESVDRVISASDNTSLRVVWSGTYQIDDHQQVTLRIGKAVYFARLTWRTGGQTIEFNQDVILTMSGAATYRRSVSSPARRPHRDLELYPGAVR